MPPSPAKNKTARLILIATGVVLVLVIAGVAANWKWKWLTPTGEPKYETPALSPDYLPSDTGAVLRLNVRQLQDTKFVKKEFASAWRSLREELASSDLQQSLGVDVACDVEWMQLTVMAGDNLDHPLVLMAGEFEAAKFKPTPKGLRAVNKPGVRYRLYELPDTQFNRTFTLALGDHLLLLCDKPSRVTEALADVAAGRKPALDDATLAELLKKVDRQQAIWLAASVKKLSPIPRLQPALAEAILRPILQNADALYGGIDAGDELQGTLIFLTASEQKATALEQQLRDLVSIVPLSAALTPAQLQPLLKLLGTGDVSRMENTVTLRCRLPEKK